MKSVRTFLLAGLAAMSWVMPAMAQTSASGPSAPAAATAMSQAPILTASQRTTIARDLIAKWQSAAAKRPGGDGPRWARILAKAVGTADAANVLKATTVRSVEELHDALIGADPEVAQPQPSTATIGNGTVSPQFLGSTTADLVYTPLPNGRCRIADSRVINSPLVGTRSLSIEEMANYTSQGGNGTYSSGPGSANCGINYLTTAYAVSVTLLSPGGAGGFKVFQYGQPYQTGSSVWMNAGTSGASADLIVRNCRACSAELGIYSAASVHYIIDVIGYYMPPQATALGCLSTAENSTSLAAGDVGHVDAPYCPSGYAETATQCRAGTWNATFSLFTSGRCAALNGNPTLAAAIYASRRCCRVPGR